MATTPISIDRFPGLKLLPEEAETTGAVSMLNADVARDLTAVSTRVGMTRLGTGTANYHLISRLTTASAISLAQTNALLLCRLASADLKVDTIDLSTGTVTNRGTVSAGGGGGAVYASSTTTFGTGEGALLTYIASYSSADRANGALKTWDGSAFTDSSPAAKPRFVAVTPWDFRLVEACFTAAGATESPTGADGSLSSVFFSNPGAPGTFGANNFVKLRPFDGEEIVGMVTWQNLLLISKQSNLFVIYGTGTDADGNPTWDQTTRRLELPARCRKASPSGSVMCAGPDGVYMLLADGVYRTTGDVPVKVSRAIDSLFNGTGLAAMLVPSTGSWSLSASGLRVYLTYTVGATYRTLVYDVALGEWLLWDLSAGTSVQPTNVVEWLDSSGAVVTYTAAGSKVYSLAGTSDDGTAISWNYKSGAYDLGTPGQVKILLESAMWGIGTVTLQVASDYGSLDTGSAVTLGTSPAVAEGWQQIDREGTLLQHQVSGSGPGTVNRLVHYVSFVKPPGVQ